MKLRNLARGLQWKRKSFRLLWKRLNLLLSRKRPRSCAPNLRSHLSVPTLTVASRIRKRSLRTHAATTSVTLTLSRPVLKQRPRVRLRESYNMAERRCIALSGEIEELRTSLERAERARKAAENELSDANDRANELTAQVSSVSGQKRKLEGDVQAMQTDLEEMSTELRASEERSKKAMSDAARLADELRHEQEHSSQVEKLRKGLENQLKDFQVRLEEAEAQALKGGKKMIQKLENRVRELKNELDNEQRRHAETQKNT